MLETRSAELDAGAVMRATSASRGNDEPRTEEEMNEQIQAAMASVVADLESDATRLMNARVHTEQRWLKSLRLYHGIYEKEVDVVLSQDEGRSRVFINFTRPKTNDWKARLGDLLFPADEKNWGINPTPVPSVGSGGR